MEQLLDKIKLCDEELERSNQLSTGTSIEGALKLVNKIKSEKKLMLLLTKYLIIKLSNDFNLNILLKNLLYLKTLFKIFSVKKYVCLL